MVTIVLVTHYVKVASPIFFPVKLHIYIIYILQDHRNIRIHNYTLKTISIYIIYILKISNNKPILQILDEIHGGETLALPFDTRHNSI